MTNTNKLFQKIVNGQSAMKQDILKEVKKIDKKVDKLENKMESGFKKVNDKLDKIGKSIAYLEDDALPEPVAP